MSERRVPQRQLKQENSRLCLTFLLQTVEYSITFILILMHFEKKVSKVIEGTLCCLCQLFFS